jgi:hypothetical protein
MLERKASHEGTNIFPDSRCIYVGSWVGRYLVRFSDWTDGRISGR